MWTRKELKDRAKTAFKRTYWKCVLVALILTLLTGSISYRTSVNVKTDGNLTPEQQQQVMLDMADKLDSMGDTSLERVFFSIMSRVTRLTARTQSWQRGKLAAFMGGLGLVSLVLSILVFNPLIVGCYRFFLQNSRSVGSLSELGAGFRDNWGNVVLTMFLRNLFLALWAFLLIFPAVIKAYSYRLVPYILKEHPEFSGTQAITLSRKMMNGHKWDTFVLDLSFIGWWILSLLTLGVLALFYVGPYHQATDAELYEAVRRNYEAAFQEQQA